MDSFISSLKPQALNLNGYDDCSSILNIPFFFWYDKVVPPDVLKDSFYKTLEEFPILAGRIKTGNDARSYVKIDKNRLNLPEYTDSPCNVHFQRLKDADFDITLLPVDYSSACKSPAPPGIFGNCLRLAEFHVLRMEENSGMCIFASISHNVFDGKAYSVFMKRWAEISKSILEAQNQQDICDVNVPAKQFQHDRSVLDADTPRGSDALEPEICAMFNNPSAFSRWVAWFSPELRGRIFRYMLSSSGIRNYYAHLSNSAFQHLTESIQPFVESDVSHISANDVISALATVLLAQALHKAGRLKGEAVVLTNTIADVRPRIKRLSNANYVGNAVLLKVTVSMLDDLLKDRSPQVLAAVACNIRRSVDSLDERYCEQVGHLVNKNGTAHVSVNMKVTTVNNAFVMTNHTRFDYYSADFGSGTPILVRPTFLVFENDFIIMPSPPGQDGYELAFTLAPDVARAMMESEYWQLIH
ncbi:hypothetical protein EV175_000806 [Coemansia sp. RSA 1933]|nr:hypothetical protein EV175_000806 [Coemansia sp. RSA 1933]